jgi:hypothetical protein
MWHITDYEIGIPFGSRSAKKNQTEDERTVELDFVVKGKPVHLVIGLQDRAVDNLRVLAMTVEDMRMHQVRGIDKTMQSAYLQIEAPILEKDPYDVLGLPRGTALPVCEAQYKEMLKRYHPDRPGGSDIKTVELNDAITKIRELTK